MCLPAAALDRLVGPATAVGPTTTFQDVLAVIGWYEDADGVCNDAPPGHETGLDPTTVDEVLDYLWTADQIEGIMTLAGRHPSLDDVRRVLPGRDRLWGDDGRYLPHP